MVDYLGKFGFVGALGLSGVQGRIPSTPPMWPGVSGAAVSAPTRGGSRKKIGYNEKHTRQWILQKIHWLTTIFLHLPVRAEALRAALGTAGRCL